MVAAVRSAVTFGHNQATTTNTQTFTVPAGVQDGDVAILTLNAASGGGVVPTLNSIPAPWRQERYAEVAGTSGAYLLSADLTAADVGTTYSFQYNATRRMSGIMVIALGATRTGILSNEIIESTSSNQQTIPTLANVPANALVLAQLNVRRGGAVAAVTTWPADWTQDAFARTAYSNSPNLSTTTAHKIAASAGTYGGQSADTDLATVGVDFIVALPEAGAAAINKLRLGAGTTGLRLGSTAVDRAYLGSSQIWP